MNELIKEYFSLTGRPIATMTVEEFLLFEGKESLISVSKEDKIPVKKQSVITLKEEDVPETSLLAPSEQEASLLDMIKAIPG